MRAASGCAGALAGVGGAPLKARHSTPARPSATSTGIKMIAQDTRTHSLIARSRRLSQWRFLGLADIAAAHDKPDHHGDAADQHMWQIGREARPEIERCDAVDKNAPIEEALAGGKAAQAVEAIDGAEQLEVKGRCAGRE